MRLALFEGSDTDMEGLAGIRIGTGTEYGRGARIGVDRRDPFGAQGEVPLRHPSSA